MTPTDFGSRIASLRNEKKLTQTELAEKLNVSTQAVSKWETGAGFPDVQTIPGIARILETTTDYLFGCVKNSKRLWFSMCSRAMACPPGETTAKNTKRS